MGLCGQRLFSLPLLTSTLTASAPVRFMILLRSAKKRWKRKHPPSPLSALWNPQILPIWPSFLFQKDLKISRVKILLLMGDSQFWEIKFQARLSGQDTETLFTKERHFNFPPSLLSQARCFLYEGSNCATKDQKRALWFISFR